MPDLDLNARQAVEKRIAAAFSPITFLEPEPLIPLADDVDAQPPGTARHVDVLIATVRPVEYRAALQVFELDPRSYENGYDHRRYHRFELASPVVKRPLSVVLTMMGDMGNVSAADAHRDMRSQYQAGLSVLVGIAAGHRKSTRLGDLAIPLKIAYAEGGVALPEATLPEPDWRALPVRLKRLLDYFNLNDFAFADQLGSALEKIPRADLPRTLATPHVPRQIDDAVVISGEKVRRDDGLIDLSGVEGLHRRIKLADMESYGFAVGAGQGDWVVFRGISDFGDTEKNDEWQQVAATTACVAARIFLQEMYAPVEDATF